MGVRRSRPGAEIQNHQDNKIITIIALINVSTFIFSQVFLVIQPSLPLDLDWVVVSTCIVMQDAIPGTPHTSE
jgi:hypothetical protein